jgi:opacity protein-like surface antigen
MNRFAPAALVAVGLAALAAPAAAQETQANQALRRDKSVGVTLTTGADYSVGRYGGTADTKILVVPFSLRAKTGPFRFSATIPYLRIDGPGNIVGGGDTGPIVIDPNAPSPRQVRQGVGDLSLGVAYSLPSAALGGFDVDLGARVKLPTSSRSRGLGTGKTDFAVSADISRSIGNVSPFVTVGYRIPGKPAGLNLRNSFTGSVGTTVTAGKAVAILSYDYAGRTSAQSIDSHSLFGALSGPVAGGLTLTGYGTVGLSQGAPDYGVGLLASVKIR